MSTIPVSKRSTQARVPVTGQVSHLALPRRVSSMPNTTTGCGSAPSTASAATTTAAWHVFQLHPYAVATACTERSPSSTAAAISVFARTLIRARATIEGTDSVNDFRPQDTLVHHHFRLRHTIRGRSGPILMSRGRVLTHPFERDDLASHPGHTPTHRAAVRT